MGTARGFLLPALAGSATLTAPAAAQADRSIASVDRFVRDEVRRQEIPGLSIAVLRGDRLLLARGYGFANLEHRVPASDSTVYQSGSLGKQFTAALGLGHRPTPADPYLGHPRLHRQRRRSPPGLHRGRARPGHGGVAADVSAGPALELQQHGI